MKRRLLTAVGCLAFAAAFMVPAAAADPSNAKNATQITAVCGGSPITVVVNGNGEFSPAHDLGSTSVFIPTAFDLTFTFTPTGGSPMPETDTSAKAAPIKGTITCTIPLQTLFSGPEGTATLEGTVTGFFTPR
jgi:predicted secreted Zn-dependent protease